MTYFEYVSIAISLIFAFAITDVLRALIPALSGDRSYYPHYIWLLSTFALIFYVWTYLWGVQSIEWSGPILFYAFINPAITTLMSRLLTTPAPETIPSFSAHFHSIRATFFLLLLAFAANGFVFDWIIGQTPWGVFGDAQFGSLLGIVIAILGLVTKKDGVHYVLATTFLLMMALLVARTPSYV